MPKLWYAKPHKRDVLAANAPAKHDYLTKLQVVFSQGSDKLATHRYMPANTYDVRAYYVHNMKHEPGPVIAASPWIPTPLIEHLMRNKRDSAISTKYTEGSHISNMQGALHSFVTALVPIKMHGDYIYRRGHTVVPFQAVQGKPQYRNVVLSTMIHLDFEDDQVALQFFAIPAAGAPKSEPFPSDFHIPTAQQLSDTNLRHRYDEQLRSHARWHLHQTHSPPSPHSAAKHALSVPEATRFLQHDIFHPQWEALEGKVVKVKSSLLSLEMMQQACKHSLLNELRGLETLCLDGYVFTWDPPSIFAQLVQPGFLNHLVLHAFAEIVQSAPLPNMRAFAFNNYADNDALYMLKTILEKRRPDIRVLAKAELFDHVGYYKGHKIPGAALVLHNNSDGFGANIETEGCTSLDGAIGVYSSAAAGLDRRRTDLTAVRL